MKRPKTCGQSGGRTAQGKKCKRRAGQGTDHLGKGRCADHTAEADVAMSEKKSRVVELIEGGVKNLTEIAGEVGVDERTIYRWRKADRAFDISCEAALEESDKVRIHKVEDSLYRRLEDGKASAAEMVFYLVNRAPHRWRHVQTVQHTGHVKHEVWDLSQFNDKELRTLEQFRRRAAIVGSN
jgi:transposase-like protein